MRYADDIIVGFEHEADARRFWDAMRERLQEFSLLSMTGKIASYQTTLPKLL